jgi:hypothetical protein
MPIPVERAWQASEAIVVQRDDERRLIAHTEHRRRQCREQIVHVDDVGAVFPSEPLDVADGLPGPQDTETHARLPHYAICLDGRRPENNVVAGFLEQSNLVVDDPVLARRGA